MSVVTRTGTTCAFDQRERHAPVPHAPGGQQICPPRGLSPAVLKRIALLPQRDRAIVELTLRSHLSRSGIGRALGMSPGQVSRRLRVLYARLHDPLVVALADDRCPLSREFRQLGIEHYLLGLRVRQLSETHRLPPGEVRRMLAYLRGWQKGLGAGMRT